jgi:hypothetical protein
VLQTSTAGTPETTVTGQAATGAPIARVESATPEPVPTASPPLPAVGEPSEAGQSAWPWISLFLGVLAGLAAVAAAGGWLFLRK